MFKEQLINALRVTSSWFILLTAMFGVGSVGFYAGKITKTMNTYYTFLASCERENTSEFCQAFLLTGGKIAPVAELKRPTSAFLVEKK